MANDETYWNSAEATFPSASTVTVALCSRRSIFFFVPTSYGICLLYPPVLLLPRSYNAKGILKNFLLVLCGFNRWLESNIMCVFYVLAITQVVVLCIYCIFCH